MQISKSVEWLFRPLPILPNSIDEDNEVLVHLDILGADIKLTRRKYHSYCRHWNFDTVYNNEE